MITPARLEKYDGVPYFGSKVVLLVPATDETSKAPGDMNGKRMAIEAGTTYEKTITDLNSKLETLATSDPKTILDATQKNLEALLK